MQVEEYLKASEKTLSANYHYDVNDNREAEMHFFAKKFIEASCELDVMKKIKFYGKNVPVPARGMNEFLPNDEFKRDADGAEKLLHGAIGLATETGELMQAVLAAKCEGKELDVVNVKEELGDLMWYLAIFLRELNLDLHDVMQVNIDKLKARYGDKFSEEKANNRDLNKERDILSK
jgi:NTP pyrophosphatase (non-canonical NTP hydrolase)